MLIGALRVRSAYARRALLNARACRVPLGACRAAPASRGKRSRSSRACVTRPRWDRWCGAATPITASPSRSGLPSRPSGHPIADPCPHVPPRTRCTTPQRPNGPVQPPNHSPLISPDNHPSQPPNCSTADPPLDRRRVPECGCPARRARPPSGPRGCHVMRLSTASALPSAWVARVGVSRLSTDAPACEDGTATLTSL